MHDPARRRDGLCLYGAARGTRDDVDAAAEQKAYSRPRHRDRAAVRAIQIIVVACHFEGFILSSSAPGLTRRSMLKRRCPPPTGGSQRRHVSMDCRVKPGNDE